MKMVSIVCSGSPGNMVRQSVKLIGGPSTLLPNKDKRVLIKPNFGCHKNALTGATTDLRVLSALIEMLQEEGYSEIVVGDGGMVGYLKLDIMKYLGVSSLCKRLGVHVVDLNQDDFVVTTLRSGCRVKISKTVLESNVINLAKLKTHVLTTVTLGVKNLLGCVVGSDKRQVHLNGLHESLACLPVVIKPKLTIIEGIHGMEGRGPVAGEPKESNLVVASADVIAADMVASKVIGFDPVRIRHIAQAMRMTPGNTWDNISTVGASLSEAKCPFKPAVPMKLEANYYLNRLKHLVRGGPFYPMALTLMSNRLVSAVVKSVGVMQEEMDYSPSSSIRVINELCVGCGTCREVCPAKAISIINGKARLNADECIKCFCCVEICPYSAISS